MEDGKWPAILAVNHPLHAASHRKITEGSEGDSVTGAIQLTQAESVQPAALANAETQSQRRTNGTNDMVWV